MSQKTKFASNDYQNEQATKKIKLKKNENFHSSNNQDQDLANNKLKKSIFKYDSNEFYELLNLHGLDNNLCDLLLKNNFNGELFQSCPVKSLSEFKKHIEKTVLKDSSKLNENDSKHLFAILNRYIKNCYQSNSKIICDGVHKLINIHPLLIKIIDTPQFQRLRLLKQLGVLVYVYPSVTHTRFEHSIGTSHIAGLFIRQLKENQPSLKINLVDELSVRIAGLCHDLGHGPYSHMFEEVLEKIGCHWKHETASLKLFDKMLLENDGLKEEFEAYGLFENDIQFIKDLIYCEIFKEKSSDQELTYEQKLSNVKSLKEKGLEKSFLFEIISNNKNGIDVDKFDYFERDCAHLGFRNNFDFKRYISCVKIIKLNGLNQICVRDKEISNLYEMFHMREYLTRRAYKHETGASINLMVTEALAKADTYYNFSELLNDKTFNGFERLNDNIFWDIYYSNDPKLKESKSILERIIKRKLYKHVCSLVLDEKSNKIKKDILDKEIKDFLSKESKNEFNTENVVVEVTKFNYGSNDKNPLENVRFYSKYSNSPFKIEKNQVSGMLLNKFEDVVLRIYSKTADIEFINELNKFIVKWSQSKGYPNPLYGTLN